MFITKYNDFLALLFCSLSFELTVLLILSVVLNQITRKPGMSNIHGIGIKMKYALDACDYFL